MRLVSTLFAASLTAGCAATGPVTGGSVAPASTASASTAAFTVDPRPEPTPLGPRSPTSRPNREIEQMASAELARWILPEQAGEVASAEIFPPRWGVITYAYLWQAPRPAGPSGVCQVDGWGVGFRIENERSLTPQQSINPPLAPAWTVPERRFRVPGSIRAPLTPEACATGLYWRWSEAPSAEALHAAAALVEEAQQGSGRGATGFRLTCTQMKIDEASGITTDRACAEPRAFLKSLTPELIKRVRRSACEGDISATGEGECIAIEYHDPQAPGTHSIYMIRIAGRDVPRAVEIVQGMLPPQ
jgi:hypothetical protein